LIIMEFFKRMGDRNVSVKWEFVFLFSINYFSVILIIKIKIYFIVWIFLWILSS
jgi:hypothetical protein